MPLLLKKKPAAAAPVVIVSPGLSVHAALIDALGRLQPEFDERQAEIKRLAELQKPFAKMAKELQDALNLIGGDDETLEEKGKRFIAEAGARGTTREVNNIKKAIELMGEVQFLKVCKLPLGVIDKYLTPEQQKKVLKYTREGRTLRIVPNPAARKTLKLSLK